jgi:hypothetical protein
MNHRGRHGDSGTVEARVKFVIRGIWTAWKRFGQFVGDMIARVVLSLFYFTLFVPFALGVRLFGDPLAMKAEANPSWWLERTTRDLALDDARRQF